MSEHVIDYIRAKKEAEELGEVPLFVQGILRSNNTAVMRHGVRTPDGKFMTSTGRIVDLFQTTEIIHVKKETEVYLGNDNLFIRFSVPSGSVIKFQDGTTFREVKAIRPTTIFKRNIVIPGKDIVLPFDFIVTDIWHNNGTIDIAITGKYAFQRRAQIGYRDFGVRTEEVGTEDAAYSKHVLKLMEESARVKFNLDEGGSKNVHILEDNRR